MTAQGAHKVTEMFEAELCRYTGAPYAVAVDSATSGLALCLTREIKPRQVISIPSRTYMSVACEILFSGGLIEFLPVKGNTLTGAYQLGGTRIWDSALRFTADMYLPGQLMCVSFTGAYKHLKLGKGGAVLLDDKKVYQWLKKARNSGRNECSYHVDTFDMIGRNCYMMPQIAAQGLLLMTQFYELDGTKRHLPDLVLPYPDLSKFTVYTNTGMVGIYKITSPSGNLYIGQSIDINRRFRTYLSGKAKSQRLLQRSFDKYGVNNHTFEVVLRFQFTDFALLDFHEKRLIKEFKASGATLLNLTEGGEGSKGIKLSEQAKSILRQKALGRKHSEATKIKIGNISRGRKFSEEHKRKLSESNKGGPGWTGHKHTEETKRLISKRLTGRTFSAEHCKNIQIAQRKLADGKRGNGTPNLI